MSDITRPADAASETGLRALEQELSHPGEQQPRYANDMERVIAGAIADRRQLVERLEKAEATADQWVRHGERLAAELEVTQRELAETKSRCDYYLRHTTELTTRLSTAVSILQDALQGAESESRRPTVRTHHDA